MNKEQLIYDIRKTIDLCVFNAENSKNQKSKLYNEGMGLGLSRYIDDIEESLSEKNKKFNFFEGVFYFAFSAFLLSGFVDYLLKALEVILRIFK